MTDLSNIVIPKPTAANLKAALAQPILAEGDYRFVVKRLPSRSQGQGDRSHELSLLIPLTPLVDPNSGTSAHAFANVLMRLTCPVAVLSDVQLALPEAQRPQIRPMDITTTMKVFYAITDDEVFNPPKYLKKETGMTPEEFKSLNAKALDATRDAFNEVFQNPSLALQWCIHGRVKHSISKKNGNTYPNVNVYTDGYVKSGSVKPSWNYSEPKMV